MKIDTSNTDQGYWEKVLSESGSGMNRGSLRDDPSQKTALMLMLLGMAEDLEKFFGKSRRALTPEELAEVQEGFEIVEHVSHKQ